MQQVKAEIIIPIPENMILVEKSDFERLSKEKLLGRNWTMKDLEVATARKRDWLVENLLYKPQFKKDLEKIVHYPKGKGDPWLFQASKMTEFLESNFYKIFNS